MKLVLVVLLVLGLLYGLSMYFKNDSKPDPDKALASLRSSLGNGVKSLSDRFSPGFDFKTVNDPHLNAKTRTITVPRGSAVNIRVNASSGTQRLTFTQVQPVCKVVYTDSKPKVERQTENPPETKNTLGITEQGGILTISSNSPSQDCILKVK
jgi:hypothetical protein